VLLLIFYIGEANATEEPVKARGAAGLSINKGSEANATEESARTQGASWSQYMSKRKLLIHAK
jgi:hypothetical protein